MSYDFRLLHSTILTISIIFLSACTQLDTSKEVVAYVNKEPIYASELKREIARKAQCDPLFKLTPDAECDYLESLINRKLIVQAAMKKGLAQEERFVNTIKAFWEQTLIRDFIDYKNRQGKDYLFVTDEDASNYYSNLSKKVTFKILKLKDKSSLEAAYQKYLKNKDTSRWQTTEPLGYEDITSAALLEAFRLPLEKGEKFDDGSNYYLITVVAREDVPLEPLEKLRPEIEKSVVALKERLLFEDWLNKERKKAKIEINKEYLK
jgi:parvulin-like peptidyl-prolyl isomerase